MVWIQVQFTLWASGYIDDMGTVHSLRAMKGKKLLDYSPSFSLVNTCNQKLSFLAYFWFLFLIHVPHRSLIQSLGNALGCSAQPQGKKSLSASCFPWCWRGEELYRVGCCGCTIMGGKAEPPPACGQGCSWHWGRYGTTVGGGLGRSKHCLLPWSFDKA